MNAQKESLKNNFRGSHKLPQAHEKVCNENERRKKEQQAPKIIFDGRKEFIRRVRKTRLMDIKRLQVNDSSYIWRYYLFSKRVNRCQGDRFLSVGAQTGAIKLAMAGT